MLTAIQFEDQPAPEAGKIHDVWPDRHLTAKARILGLLSPQPGPQHALGFGRGPAKFPCKDFEPKGAPVDAWSKA